MVRYVRRLAPVAIVGMLTSTSCPALAAERWTGGIDLSGASPLSREEEATVRNSMQAIYSTLDESGHYLQLPQIGIKVQEHGEIASSPSKIVIPRSTLAMLCISETNGSLTFALAHELGHHHLKRSADEGMLQFEMRIDEFALRATAGRHVVSKAREEPALDDLLELVLSLDAAATGVGGSIQGHGPRDMPAGTRVIAAATRCVLKVELTLRASFLREQQVRRPTFTSRSRREASAEIMNAEIALRRELRAKMSECEDVIRQAEGTNGATADVLSLRRRLLLFEAVRKVADDQVEVLPGDDRLDGEASRWRDDATADVGVAVGAWLPRQTGNYLVGWSSTFQFALPTFIEDEKVPKTGDDPKLPYVLLGINHATRQVVSKPTGVGAITSFRLGMSIAEQKDYDHHPWFRSVEATVSASYDRLSTEDASEQHWTAFAEIRGGLGYKMTKRARLIISAGLGAGFINLFRLEGSILVGARAFCW